MGYYSNFAMTVDYDHLPVGQKTRKAFCDELNKMVVFGTVGESEILGMDNGSFDKFFASEIKWYDAKTDVLRLSSRFPDFLFTVEREGGDNGDMEMFYCKGGKIQADAKEVKITVHPFDEAKLETKSVPKRYSCQSRY